MAQAIFSSNITYAPGGGGSLTQNFGVTATYAAINAGTIDVPSTVTTTDPIAIPFGSVDVTGGGARGVFVRNNAGADIKLYVNRDTGTAPAPTDKFFQLPAGGMLMYWIPAAVTPSANAVVAMQAFLQATGPGGTIDYITLGG